MSFQSVVRGIYWIRNNYNTFIYNSNSQFLTLGHVYLFTSRNMYLCN